MPRLRGAKLQLALNDRGKPMKGSKVLVLGLAYKKDIDDPRESPAFEIIEHLLQLGAEVAYHDPHVPEAPQMRSWPDLPPMVSSQPLTEELLAAQDAVVIVTDHSAVDYELVVAPRRSGRRHPRYISGAAPERRQGLIPALVAGAPGRI